MLDAISAIADFIMMVFSPKYMSRRKRLRLLKKKAMELVKEKVKAEMEAEQKSQPAFLSVDEAKQAKTRSPRTPRRSKSSTDLFSIQAEEGSQELSEQRIDSVGRRSSFVKGSLLPSRKFDQEKLEALGIDQETQKVLMDAEYYHYLTVQIRINTICQIINSIFGLGLCALSYFSMDYELLNSRWGTNFTPGPFLRQFAFGCHPDQPTRWDLENPKNPGFPVMRAETNFTCQIVYVYLYSTIQLIVLSTVPYRYDRFVKTEEQQRIDKQRQLKQV